MFRTRQTKLFEKFLRMALLPPSQDRSASREAEMVREAPRSSTFQKESPSIARPMCSLRIPGTTLFEKLLQPAWSRPWRAWLGLQAARTELQVALGSIFLLA